jgi:hypothetical protein
MKRFGWRFIQENILMLFLTFLAVEFLAIVQFYPETPMPENPLIAMTMPADDDDTEAKGKATTPVKTHHGKATVQQQLQQLDQKELSVQGLAFLIFGLEALILLPFVVAIAWFYHMPTLAPAPKAKPAVKTRPVSAN